jgi:hypothetical protein
MAKASNPEDIIIYLEY